MTTDNQNEIFEVVDEEDNVVRQATRGEVHKNRNLIHRSVGVAVFNSHGELYLQQRSATKDTDPLKWTISCSGHVESSSRRQNFLARKISIFHNCVVILNVIQKLVSKFFPYSWNKHTVCDLRKFYHASKNLLIYKQTAHRELMEELGMDLEIEPVCKYLCRAPNETEMTMLYKTVSDGPFKLHPQEISQGKFFTRKKLSEAIRSGKIELSFMGKIALGKIGWVYLQ